MTENAKNDDFVLFSSAPSITSKLLTRKQLFFNMCQALIPKSSMSPLAASALIFFSFAQLMALEFTTSFTSENLVKTFLNTTRLFYEIESIKSPLLYCCTLATVSVMIIIFVCSMLIKLFHPLSPFVSYMAYMIPFIFWVLMIPITELLVSSWQCGENGKHIVLDTTCWSPLHTVVAIFSIIMVVLWTISVIVMIVVVSYSQPHKQDAFAHFPWNFEALYTILRILYCFCTRFNAVNYIKLPLIITTLLYFFSLIWEVYPYYHPMVAFTFSIGVLCNTVSLIVSGIKFCFDIFDLSTDGLLEVSCFAFILISFSVSLSQNRWYKFLLTRNSMSSVIVIDTKIHMIRNIFIDSVKYIDSQEACLSMMFYGEHEDEQKVVYNELNTREAQMHSNSTEEIIMQENRSLMFSLITRYDINDASSTSFIIRMSGVYLSLMGNVYMSYMHLIEAEKQDPGLLAQFAIYLEKNDILSAIESKNRKAERKFGYSKFQKVIQFESEFKNLRRKMVEQANVRNDFWSNLKSNPSLNKLHSLGIDFIKLNSEIRSSWNILIELNSGHNLATKLFRSYVKNILGDTEEASSLDRKIRLETLERGWRTLCLEETFSEHVAIIVISGDEAKILRSSNATVQIFQYEQKELFGRNIKMLMPPIIGLQHQRFLENFYKNDAKRQVGKQFETFGLNRNGYIIPIHLAIQPFYSLSLGLLYMGAIQVEPRYNDENYIITDCTGRIGGITSSLCRQLQLTPAMISERKLYLQNICPDLLEGDIRTMEGGMTLKFMATMCSVGISRSKGNRSSYMERSEVMCTVKCEVNTEKYSSGLTIKKFKIGKSIGQGIDNKKKQPTISAEVMQSITTIFRAIRKLKAIVTKIRMKKLLNNRRSKLSLGPIPDSTLNYYKNMEQKEEEKESKEEVNDEEFPTITKEDTHTSKPGLKRQVSGRQIKRPQPVRKESPKRLKATDLNMMSQVPSSTNNALLKKSVATPEKENTSKDIASPKILKRLSDQRKKDNDSPNSRSIINYVKIATQLFIALVMILLSIRVGISVWLNAKVVDSSPIMLVNNERLAALGFIGGCMEVLTLHYPYGGLNYSIFDDSVRNSKYDYSAILRRRNPNSTVKNYYDYIIYRSKSEIQDLLNSQSSIQKLAIEYSSDLSEVIDGIRLSVGYNMKGKRFNVSMSVQMALFVMVSTSLNLLESIEQGTYSSSDYLGETVINNTLSNMINGLRPTANYIIDNAYKTIELHNNFSTSAFITLLVLYLVYFILLIPFLYLTNKDMISMLMPFLDISRHEINEQHEKALKFLKKVYRSEKLKQKDLEMDNMPQAEYVNEEEEEEEEEGDKTKQDNESAEINAKKHDSRRHSNKVRSYIQYKSNIWKLLFLFCTFSAFVIVVYFLLDFFAKSVTSTATYKMTELKSFSRSLYANMYIVPYMYLYIMSNKTGYCGGNSLCEDYFPQFYTLRIQELNEIMMYHKGNLSVLSSDYNSLFTNIFENNPCTIPSLKKNINCTTTLGGIFTNGLHASSVAVLDLAISVFRDFQETKGRWQDIIQYINDPRTVDIEISNTLLINPALRLMINYLSNSLSGDYHSGIILISALISLFVVTFLIVSIVWLNWILEYMEHSIFGTKSILTSLPDEIITKHESIYKHILDT